MCLSLRNLIGALAAIALVQSALAQQTGPHIGYVYPAGGQRGTTFRVAVGGQRLTGVRAALVSGDKVRADVVEHIVPMTPKQMLLLRDELKELMDRKSASTVAARSATQPATRPWTAEDEKRAAEIQAKLAAYQRKPASVAIAETVVVEITIAMDAEPGERDLRLLTRAGLTNPLVFQIGQLREFRETESKSSRSSDETPVTLPALVNGQILPGDVDRFHFTARKGQHLVAVASARKLVPYLADAVPGWFQATLALYDSTGAAVAYADDYRFDPDPVLHLVAATDGEYVLEIKDSIYRGREDFVYRIALGELPFITGIFPLGGRVGEKTAIEITGWNLPVTRMLMNPGPKPPGLYPVSVCKGEVTSNAVPFALEDLPKCLEAEPNDSAGTAKALTLPVVVDGRINRAGDEDLFRFAGRKDERIVAEVYSRRLGSPLDPVLVLGDEGGRQLAFNDDHPDLACGLNTHHADSLLTITLPADGKYYLRLRDVQGKGGSEYGYRLRLGEQRPDFELRVVPSSINMRSGAPVPLTVHVMRRDGFHGAIDLALQDAPRGLRLDRGRIPEGQDSLRINLSLSQRPTSEVLTLRMNGRGVVDGRDVVHEAAPADDMMQAFIYHHLVCAKELKMAVLSSRDAKRNDASTKPSSSLKN
jgi:hypothetical protein